MSKKRVLVACEYSGTVRNHFMMKGWDAWSCDLLPTESKGNHYQGDVRDIIKEDWDLLIAHPPCTHLARAGVKYHWGKKVEDILEGKPDRQREGIRFCHFFWFQKHIPRICIENPVGVLSTKSFLGSPDQIIQPWEYGHRQYKATCLWLKNLPRLEPTNILPMEKREKSLAIGGWYNSASAKERAKTFRGIAKAMANQWGSL